MPRARDRGVALVAALSWLVAASSLVLAVYAWSGGGPTRYRGVSGGPETDELRALRLALNKSHAENGALRGELERMVARRVEGASAASGPPGAAPSTATAEPTPAATEERLHEISLHIRDRLARAAAVGTEEANRDAAFALMEAFQLGSAGFPAVREAYTAATDPKARALMLPTMMFIGGEEARDFLTQQLQTEADPELRGSLLIFATRYATPDYVPVLKDSFVAALSADVPPNVRAAAIRGLRYAKGPEIQQALLAALGDASEEARLAAIETLASRPSLRAQLREAIGKEPSSQVREIGECRLLVAESGGE
jgi:hypothetical protein